VPKRRKKNKGATPKKRGQREPKSLGVLTINAGRGRAVGDTRAKNRSHKAFRKSSKSSSETPVPRPSYLPTGPIKIKGKLVKDLEGDE
jgi:hypothetical protein